MAKRRQVPPPSAREADGSFPTLPPPPVACGGGVWWLGVRMHDRYDSYVYSIYIYIYIFMYHTCMDMNGWVTAGNKHVGKHVLI